MTLHRHLKASAVAAWPTGEPWDLAELHEELSNAGRLSGCEMTRRFYEIDSFEGLAETNLCSPPCQLRFVDPAGSSRPSGPGICLSPIRLPAMSGHEN